jgi:hypothetical protein
MTTDTDGILNKCSCGALACMRSWPSSGKRYWQTECSDRCGEATGVCDRRDMAMAEWNQWMRGLKK